MQAERAHDMAGGASLPVHVLGCVEGIFSTVECPHYGLAMRLRMRQIRGWGDEARHC
jgi:hypothetical protein